MGKLLQHLHLLPGRVIVKRKPGHWHGEVVAGPMVGYRVSLGRVKATFQKGKTHYAVALLRHCVRISDAGRA
jgi:hypothetical protein